MSDMCTDNDHVPGETALDHFSPPHTLSCAWSGHTYVWFVQLGRKCHPKHQLGSRFQNRDLSGGVESGHHFVMLMTMRAWSAHWSEFV